MEGITYQQAGRKRAYFEEDDDPIFVARRTTGAANGRNYISTSR
nr:MAG TPA: hypothetical protein [Cressdnaviricota sp.]